MNKIINYLFKHKHNCVYVCNDTHKYSKNT